jgi:predicted nucleic acid-binding protein
VILVDTSAWVEYLRATGSLTHRRLRDLVAQDADLAIADVVVMELLAGARDRRHHSDLRRLLRRFTLAPVGGLETYENAAELYRLCRAHGTTVRKLTDCLIAAVAIREDAALLHADADFAALRRHTALQVDEGSRQPTT